MDILKQNSISEIKYPLGRLGKSRMEIMKKSISKQNQSIEVSQSKKQKKQLQMPSRTQFSQMTPQPHPIRSLKFYSLKGKTKGLWIRRPRIVGKRHNTVNRKIKRKFTH